MQFRNKVIPQPPPWLTDGIDGCSLCTLIFSVGSITEILLNVPSIFDNVNTSCSAGEEPKRQKKDCSEGILMILKFYFFCGSLRRTE